jgi:hypothetical protein
MLDFETAKRLFYYSPATGELIWKVNVGGNGKTGNVAGCINRQGYRVIRVYGKRYQAHRIVYLLHYNAWPLDCIDHINSNRGDNRIGNLRVINHTLNSRRQKKRIDNTSGFTGVRYNLKDNRYIARIKVNNKTLYLGCFAPINTIPDSCPNLKIRYPDGIPLDSNLNKLYCFALYCDAVMTYHGFEYSTLQQYMYPDRPTMICADGAGDMER